MCTTQLQQLVTVNFEHIYTFCIILRVNITSLNINKLISVMETVFFFYVRTEFLILFGQV
jgi:hypothetical protein